MEKANNNLRERILSHLPQPENLAAYREETASLLAKHERALFWEKAPATLASVSAIVMFVAHWFWAQRTGSAMNQTVWFGFGGLIVAGVIFDLRYRINRSKVDLLKEIKQVQLQMLELQSAIEKTGKAE